MEISEKPILVSGPLIGPILRGTKTQTRRILKGSTEHPALYSHAYLEAHRNAPGWKEICPHGKIGDRLWVRETHGIMKQTGDVVYLADGGWAEVCGFKNALKNRKWIPSIHMKRKHSRIDLEIVDIRVQRAQEISEEDAKAEGVFFSYDEKTKTNSFRAGFRNTWIELYGEKSWEDNPWVWAITFKKIKG